MKGFIFTLGLTYGGAIVSLFRPWYGLLIYVCFAIIRPEHLWSWSFSQGGNSSRIVAIALLVGWTIHGLGNWDFGRAKGTVLALIGFWCWAVASGIIAASNSEVAFGFVEMQAKIVLPFVAAVTMIDSEKKVKQLAWVILVSQGYLAFDMNQTYFTSFNPLQTPWGTGGFGGMDNNCVAIAMVTGAGLAFFLGMHERGFKKWFALACAALMVHTVLFSFSRGGMVGMIIMGGVCFLLIDKGPKEFAMFALAVAAGLVLAGPEVREEFLSSFADSEHRDASSQSRVDMWGNCITVMAGQPLFGVGPDHWPLIASRYGWPEGKEAHTLWLQTGAELGVVGLGLLLTFYLLTMWRLWPFARRKVDEATEWDVAVARMIIASFTGFMISAQFVSLEGLELPYYINILGAGTLKLHSLRLREAEQVDAWPDVSLACAPPLAREYASAAH